MNNLKLTWQIALWEFRRWFKWKDQILTLAVSVIVCLLIFGTKSIFQKEKKINIAVLNENILPFNSDNKNISFILNQNKSEEALHSELINNEIDGYVVVKNIDTAFIYSKKMKPWIQEISVQLSQARAETKIKNLKISNEVFADISSGIKLNILLENSNKVLPLEMYAAAFFISIMFFGIFLGLSYQFITITGEKQLNITEQIITAVSPQTWIDGKILGISMLSIVLSFVYIICGVVFIILSQMFGSGWDFPLSVQNPVKIIILAFLSLGGFLFWNVFFAAVASTINDPNTSAKSAFLFLPLIPSGLAYIVLVDPDALWAKVFSLFPITAPSFMSARVVLSSVPALEMVISILLIFVSIYLFRIAAGKIFALSILMRGKEPSFGEMLKWIKKV